MGPNKFRKLEYRRVEIFSNFLNNAQIDMDGGPQDGQGDTGLGYAAGLTKETARNAWNSSAFVQDVFDYYQERDGKTFTSDRRSQRLFHGRPPLAQHEHCIHWPRHIRQ